MTYQLGHDYGLKTRQQVGILSVAGRLALLYTGPGPQVASIQAGHHGAQIGASRLGYDWLRKQCSLLVSLEIEVAAPCQRAGDAS